MTIHNILLATLIKSERPKKHMSWNQVNTIPACTEIDQCSITKLIMLKLGIGASSYSWLFYMILSCLSPGVCENLTCYSCTQVNYHEGCNLKTEICSGVDQVCLTKVEKLDSIGKVYTKGCMLTRTSSGLEGLNRDYICAYYPSTCFYCCSGSLCNQYNTAVKKTDYTSLACLCLLSGFSNLVFAYR